MTSGAPAFRPAKRPAAAHEHTGGTQTRILRSPGPAAVTHCGRRAARPCVLMSVSVPLKTCSEDRLPMVITVGGPHRRAFSLCLGFRPQPKYILPGSVPAGCYNATEYQRAEWRQSRQSEVDRRPRAPLPALTRLAQLRKRPCPVARAHAHALAVGKRPLARQAVLASNRARASALRSCPAFGH